MRKINHPFSWLPETHHNRVFILLFVLTLILLMFMSLIDAPLKTSAAPNGIISIEFAGKLTVAQEIIHSWGLKGQIYAGLSLGIDFLFLFAYSLTLSLGCVLVSSSLSQPGQILYQFGVRLAWAQFGAAILDSVENYALIKILLGSQREIFAVVAYWCAMPKFMIVFIGIGYILFGLGIYFFRKIVK